MDFLIRIDTSRVYELPDGEREDVIAREHARGRELMAQGVLRHFWRLPGRRANVGIWTAPEADTLHEALASLPIWKYADFDITPLATHPLTRQAAA
ncbi:muconolactone Delta-isomerase family protein [Amycolatopsis sp. La24]|uniref:muconolactone Delta-isomerase family protein n=1 Tax=Amycolatopsis sp. La24 TaxID=3028304 RepID=UPI0023B1ACBB|nr:muconolactone Delta-isomerase family protein [Amycolatopsis sp. La24]